MNRERKADAFDMLIVIILGAMALLMFEASATPGEIKSGRGQPHSTTLRSGLPMELELPAVQELTNGIKLAWDASPSSGIAGYRIYQGIGSRNYTNATDVGNVLTGKAAHPFGVTNFYAVTAYGTNGVESDWSVELTNAPPPAVYGLLFLQASSNGVTFSDVAVTPYLRLTNGLGGPLPWQWFRSRTEITTNWR